MNGRTGTKIEVKGGKWMDFYNKKKEVGIMGKSGWMVEQEQRWELKWGKSMEGSKRKA